MERKGFKMSKKKQNVNKKQKKKENNNKVWDSNKWAVFIVSSLIMLISLANFILNHVSIVITFK
jgi:hypothetical protein